jgi:hypothetical protein
MLIKWIKPPVINRAVFNLSTRHHLAAFLSYDEKRTTFAENLNSFSVNFYLIIDKTLTISIFAQRSELVSWETAS